MKVKEEREKPAVKLSIKKATIMTSGPVASWQIEGEKVEAVTDFIFLGSKITAEPWNHETMKLKDACSLDEKLWPT